MVSVIRLDSDEVQKLCDSANQDVDEDNKVQIASYLCPGNYAVSGGVKGVEAVEAKAKPFKERMTAIHFLKMGNNSDDSPSQRAEEELRIRTWKGSSSSMPLRLQNQSHLAVIYTLGASYLAEFIHFIRLLLALSREWTGKQKQRILAPEMAAGGVPQVVPDQR
ncbi:hypothetical protein OIU85_001551 [Salix viminalis]|uniref:Uncharacterized protein n=1 Tax=Salix viminalis TaxID=40686 RepID=A0A9Q0VP21_SALVM|nr:hypothetical protein OIU85_001551 [Salix viminalis]